ncbi:MAG: tRNA pseudouridine(38-40) synthase TruA [Chlamydiae bacterium]|nr:tRNA pseudouridine(38-40) synthase TruA [Chlamydiota bacterium]
MHTYKMTIAYEGTSYGGWQIQPNSTSIQYLISSALSTYLREEIKLIGSGRTDAGVHALGQVAHFRTHQTPSLAKLQYALNSMLPHDIRILNLEEVSKEFHAQYSALGKIYHYHLHLDPVINPFTRRYSWHVPHRVDLNMLQNLLPFFLGKKDFTSFANEAHKGAAAKGGIRTLQRITCIQEEGGVRIELEADGFLYKMVRNIVGTLMEVCSGSISPESIPLIFEAKDRKLAGRTAPPHGLFLMQVLYPLR